MLVPPETIVRTSAAEQRVARIVAYYRRRRGADPLATCLGLAEGNMPDKLAKDFRELEPAWADHAIASVYATLMSENRRKALGAFFTPPMLVQHLLARTKYFGVDLATQRVRDPAAGGAAFLVPVAREMVRIWRQEGASDTQVIKLLKQRLIGRELDPGLARLANELLRRCLIEEHGLARRLVQNLALIAEGDSLAAGADDLSGTDHEIGNPPFLRLPARYAPPEAARFADISAGRLNLYAIFVRRGLAALPPGGLLAYVLPASFLGGPEFARFRLRVRQMAEVLAVDIIEPRKSVFLNVVQDTCVLVLRKRVHEVEAPGASEAATQMVRGDGTALTMGTTRLPAGDAPWVLPGTEAILPCTLADWGYVARVGYLVANRQADRLHTRYAKGRVPLVWAKAITQDGAFDFEKGARSKGLGWVEVPAAAPYVIRTGCVAVQRTSARGQRRRIAAAEVPASFVHKNGGVVAENHVILLLPTSDKAASPAALVEALNRTEVGAQLDRMCGSASIPARLLERLPLPAPPQALPTSDTHTHLPERSSIRGYPWKVARKLATKET